MSSHIRHRAEHQRERDTDNRHARHESEHAMPRIKHITGPVSMPQAVLRKNQ